MDIQTLINALLTIAGVLGGFVLRAVWDGLKELRAADNLLADKVQGIEILVAGQYAKRDDIDEKFDRLSSGIFHKFDLIMEKLDSKVSKGDCKECK